MRTSPAGSAPTKVLIYGINFAPELTGIGRYTGDMAAWLAEQGHHVSVVTAYPYYPHWQLAAGYPSWRWSRVKQLGVRVVRCPLWVPRTPTAKTRILHLLSFMLTSAPVMLLTALRVRPDIILVVEPTMFCSPWALLAARLTGAKSWLHVQDLELAAAVGLGLLKHKPGHVRRLAQIYGRMLRAFDKVTTLSERMRTRLAQYGRPEAAIGLFPNWVNTEKFMGVDATRMRAELGLKADDVCVLYAGNLGEKQGIESLLDIARLLEDEPSVRMVICGAGAARARIESRLPDHPNVSLIDPQPDQRFVELMSAADIHVLPQKQGVTHYVMPSKLGPMMASGRPIVAQAEEGCQVAALLAAQRIAAPEDSVAAAAEIRAIARSKTLRAHLGQAAVVASEAFRRDRILPAALRGL